MLAEYVETNDRQNSDQEKHAVSQNPHIHKPLHKSISPYAPMCDVNLVADLSDDDGARRLGMDVVPNSRMTAESPSLTASPGRHSVRAGSESFRLEPPAPARSIAPKRVECGNERGKGGER